MVVKNTSKFVKGAVVGALVLTLSGCEVIGLVPMAVYGASISVGDMMEKREIRAEIQDLEDSGVIPEIDETDTRAGIDSDNNGIRDDVDAFIRYKSQTKNELLALEHMAKAFQDIQKVEHLNPDIVGDIEGRISGSVRCWSIAEYRAEKESSEDIFQIWKALEILIANTNDRSERLEEFKEISGSVSSSHCRVDEFE